MTTHAVMPPRPSIADVVLSGRRRRKKRAFSAGVVVAILAHAGILLMASLHEDPVSTWAETMRLKIGRDLDRQREISIEDPPPPPERPAPAPEPAAPPPVAARAPRSEATPARAVPAAAGAPVEQQAAQAADVLTAPEDDTADFTDRTIVTGKAATYAGGSTMASGTATRAVTGPVAPRPAPARAPSRPVATPPPLPAVDLSRPVTLSGADWSCPWPRDADRAQIDEESVVLRVRVDARGRVGAVTVLQDPGFGFGAAAQRCAYSARFTPALGADGRPADAESPPIRVRFSR